MTKLRVPDFLASIGEANSHEQIRRGGFIISGISDGESVQAHSHGVALTALGLYFILDLHSVAIPGGR